MARARLALVWALAAAPAALAQVLPPVDQLQRPRELPLPAPDLQPVPRPPEITAPALQMPAAPALSQGARVYARGFRFTGGTVFSESELQALAEPFVGRELGNAELEELRQRITRRYIEAGYINSGAVIPDQDASGGTIAFEIVEGRLSEIVVGGKNRFRPGYLRDRLALGAEPILNVNRLQERMQLLLQDPQIERIAAELAPGTQRGEAVLRADVTGTTPFFVGFNVSNERSPAVGADQAELLFGTRNLLGFGETFTLRSALTRGLEEYFVGITAPLTASGLQLALRHQSTRSHIVEEPFDQLDISARSTTSEIGLSYPLIEHPQRLLTANALLARRATSNFFLGAPSPFIPGAPDGRTVVSAARLGLEWVERSPERVLAARGLFSHGLDAFGATVGDGFADSRFNALLAQAQWVRQAYAGAGLLVLRADAQLSDGPLPGPEKYSLGGMDSVRGYRKDQYVRDTGWFGSIEYRHTVARWALREGAGPGEGAIRAAAFFDVGQARDHDSPVPNPRPIASVGPGLRWEPVPGFDAQVYYGWALRDVATPTRTLQDRGWHLRVAYSRAF